MFSCNFLKPLFSINSLQEVKSQPQNYIVDSLFDDPWTNYFRLVYLWIKNLVFNIFTITNCYLYLNFVCRRTLVPYGYIRVKTLRLVGLVLSVFCLRKHITHIRDMESISTRTGLMGLWVSFYIYLYHIVIPLNKILDCSE